MHLRTIARGCKLKFCKYMYSALRVILTCKTVFCYHGKIVESPYFLASYLHYIMRNMLIFLFQVTRPLFFALDVKIENIRTHLSSEIAKMTFSRKFHENSGDIYFWPLTNLKWPPQNPPKKHLICIIKGRLYPDISLEEM
jgi:hypothetical protein